MLCADLVHIWWWLCSLFRFQVFEEPAELKSDSVTADAPVTDSSATTRQQSQQKQKLQQQESEVDRLVADLCTGEWHVGSDASLLSDAESYVLSGCV